VTTTLQEEAKTVVDTTSPSRISNSTDTGSGNLPLTYSQTSFSCTPSRPTKEGPTATTPTRSTFLDWTLDQVTCGGRLCSSVDPNSPITAEEHYFDPKRGVVRSKTGSSYQKTTARTMDAATEANGGDIPKKEEEGTQQQQQPSFPGAGGLRQTAAMARGFADDAGRAIGSIIPTAALQQLTTRKYTLPDKTVGSQVLMYRQLLHTQCRPGLKLSRDYQGTAAQMAVMHMPWWEEGIETTKKMVISYDNLITRLWLNGAIDPFHRDSEIKAAGTEESKPTPPPVADLLDMGTSSTNEQPSDAATVSSVETFITDAGLPPIPHEFWVDRLGFQQPDPVTDFRSGGVLSLGMLVYMVESQPDICQRFLTGDAKVLPFGITCINVTDMIAKFLMLAKATDRMDALLSQKPFWKMFADPNAILAVQEIAMDMLADVVVELERERKVPALAKLHSNGTPGEPSDKVCLCVA